MNHQVFLVVVDIACVEGLADTEHQNIESFIEIIQVQLNKSLKVWV